MLFVFPKDVIPNADMVFWLIPFSFILLNGNNNFGPVSRWLNCHGCALWAKLGKFHFQVIMICKHLPGIKHSIAGSLLTLAAAMAVAAAVMAVREMIRRRRPHYSK